MKTPVIYVHIRPEEGDAPDPIKIEGAPNLAAAQQLAARIVAGQHIHLAEEGETVTAYPLHRILRVEVRQEVRVAVASGVDLGRRVGELLRN